MGTSPLPKLLYRDYSKVYTEKKCKISAKLTVQITQ